MLEKQAARKISSTIGYEQIRADILSGILRPGSRMRISAICDRYSIGAIPVREALSRLVSEGLVVRHDLKGFCVSPLSWANYCDIIHTRCLVDEIALRKSIENRSKEWEENIVVCLHRLSRENRWNEDDLSTQSVEWEKLHDAFHESLMANCGLPSLLRFCREMREKGDRYRMVAAAIGPRRRRVDDEHQLIADLVIDGKADEAVATLIKHYMDTKEILENIPGVFKEKSQER